MMRVHDPAEVASLQIAVRDDGEVLIAKPDAECTETSMPLGVWQEQNRSQIESKVLMLPVGEFPNLKCEFFLGDASASVWRSPSQPVGRFQMVARVCFGPEGC